MDTPSVGEKTGRIEQPPGGLQDNPYVGPRAYTEVEAPRFYGREHESRDLLALVVRERIVLFYAQSGAGKSSLLHARLIPGLRREGFDVLPVGRVSGDLPAGVDGTSVANLFAYNLILSLNQGLPVAERADAATLRGTSLLKYLTGQEAPAPAGEGTAAPAEQAMPELASTVLIIDQFEEILTTHPERWRERRGFFAQLRGVLDRAPNLWVVLTLREDYVAPLEVYADLLPNRMRARFYMQRMGLDAALQAVEEPAASYGRPFAPGVAQTLVDNLSRVRVPGESEPQPGPYVEPVQLQVVCYQLWENMRNKPPGPIAERDLPLGYIDQALTRFYEDRLAEALADPAAQRAGVTERGLRHWFSWELITAGGIRDTVLRNEETGRTGSVPNAAVAVLALRYLVRLEPRAGGIWVELVHDRFVGPILEANRAWFDRNSDPLTQAAQAWRDAGRAPAKLYASSQLAAAVAQMQSSPTGLGALETEFVEQGQRVEAARASRRQRRVTLAIGAVAVVFALLTAVALWSAFRASRAQRRAETSLRIASADRDTAATLAANLAAVLTAQVDQPPAPLPTDTPTATQGPSRTPSFGPSRTGRPPIIRPPTTTVPRPPATTSVPYPGATSTYRAYQRSTISAVQVQLATVQLRQTIAALGITLYIQIPAEATRDQAEKLQVFLERRGYAAPGVEVVGVGNSPAGNEVRYFYEEQGPAARVLAADLAEFGLQRVATRFVQGYAKAPRDVIEVWFGKPPQGS